MGRRLPQLPIHGIGGVGAKNERECRDVHHAMIQRRIHRSRLTSCCGCGPTIRILSDPGAGDVDALAPSEALAIPQAIANCSSCISESLFSDVPRITWLAPKSLAADAMA